MLSQPMNYMVLGIGKRHVTPRSFWMLLAVQRPYGATCFARQHCIIEPPHPPPQAGRGGCVGLITPDFSYTVFAKIGQVLITSLGKTRRERKFRTGTKPQPIQLIYKHWVQQVQAFSCLLEVLRPMFIHITSPKQGGVPVS